MNELLKKAKEGDIPSRERVVELNIPLVENLVQRFLPPPGEKEDLVQVGCIGLLKALDKFDLLRNVKFSTYAVPVILGEIKMYLRKNQVFKASRSLSTLARSIKIKKEDFLKNNGREPSIGELARDLKTTREEIVMASEINQDLLSLEESPCYPGKETAATTDLSQSQDSEEDLILNKITIKEILASLRGRERQVIFLRFFQEKSQQEIAEKLGISQVHVSRLERNTIKKIKETFQ